MVAMNLSARSTARALRARRPRGCCTAAHVPRGLAVLGDISSSAQELLSSVGKEGEDASAALYSSSVPQQAAEAAQSLPAEYLYGGAALLGAAHPHPHTTH
jgi:hypothetical protein